MCDIAQVDHYSLDAVSFAFDLGLETLHLVAVELVFDILGFPLDIFITLLFRLSTYSRDIEICRHFVGWKEYRYT